MQIRLTFNSLSVLLGDTDLYLCFLIFNMAVVWGSRTHNVHIEKDMKDEGRGGDMKAM